MSTNDHSPQKRIATELDFTTRTAKRATWEAWEFTVIAPLQVQVTNASYGVEKAAHQYTVTVEERGDDLVVPLHCECPADQYHDGDCKHKLALVVAGGLPVLRAAVAARGESDASDTETATDRGVGVATDGGVKRGLEPERAREREHTRVHRELYMAVLDESRTVRADALGLPECPEWCSSDLGSTQESLVCFRCWFTADEDERDAPSKSPRQAPPSAVEDCSLTGEEPTLVVSGDANPP